MLQVRENEISLTNERTLLKTLSVKFWRDKLSKRGATASNLKQKMPGLCWPCKNVGRVC